MEKIELEGPKVVRLFTRDQNGVLVQVTLREKEEAFHARKAGRPFGRVAGRKIAANS